MIKYESTTEDNKCVFCEIAAGNKEAPGLFWEDEEFMAWLAIDPNTEGFTCVIPRQHFASDVLKMPDEALQRFIIAAKTVAVILENHFDDVGRVGLIMEGMGVDHAHLKLIPLHGTEYLKRGEWKQAFTSKEFWFDQYEGYIVSGGGPLADPEELRKLASNIKNST